MISLPNCRWDRSMVNVLPKYMKHFYIAMLDVFEEISKEIGKDESSLHIRTAREGVNFLFLLLFSFPPFYTYI